MSDLSSDDIQWINQWFLDNPEPEHPQFDKDLNEKGRPREERVLAYVLKWDKEAYIIEGYSPGGDIVSPKLDKIFEVKSCEDAIKNVPIEISITNQKGEHLSGLSVTQSDYWVIYCKGKYHAILVPVLRELVQNIVAKEYKIHDQKVVLKILPIVTLSEHSKHIWEDL